MAEKSSFMIRPYSWEYTMTFSNGAPSVKKKRTMVTSCVLVPDPKRRKLDASEGCSAPMVRATNVRNPFPCLEPERIYPLHVYSTSNPSFNRHKVSLPVKLLHKPLTELAEFVAPTLWKELGLRLRDWRFIFPSNLPPGNATEKRPSVHLEDQYNFEGYLSITSATILIISNGAESAGKTALHHLSVAAERRKNSAI